MIVKFKNAAMLINHISPGLFCGGGGGLKLGWGTMYHTPITFECESPERRNLPW